MKRFFEVLKRVVLIGGIATMLWASVPSIAYADGGGGGGNDGQEQIPRPPNPQP